MFTLLFQLLALAAVIAAPLFSQSPPPGTPEPNEPTGVFRFQGLAGKCLDVGGYPLGHTAQVMLYDCNGTTAQDLTLVPNRTPIDSTVEIHAQQRCLGVAPPVLNIKEPPLAVGMLPIKPAPGWQVLLEPCDGTTYQRFYAPQANGIFPMNNTNLKVTVEGGHSADRTPLILEPPSAIAGPGQAWTMRPYDTTAYSYPPVRETTGAYTFQGFGGKCIDVGGVTPPDQSPIFLYGCNDSIAQMFSIKPVNEPLGIYTITAFGKCFDLAKSTVAAGEALQMNTCSGAESQQFSFDHYDRNYIYPAGTPELVIGVQGASTANRTPLQLQERTLADYQDWQPLAADNAAVGPKAPDIAFQPEMFSNPQGGLDPGVEIRVNSSMPSTQEVLWKELGQDNYSVAAVAGTSNGPQQSVLIRLANLKIENQEFYLKARSTASNGLFSESPEILIDARQLPAPVLSVQDVQAKQVTVQWQSVGTPQASSFLIRFTDPNNNQITSSLSAVPGNRLDTIPYSKQMTGLKPATKYRVDVEVHRGLWLGIYATTYITTLQATPPSPVVTTIDMTRSQVIEGPIPYGGIFGPIYTTGAVITNINFPVQYPAVWLVRRGYSTANCGDPNASVLLHGDMTAAQKQFVWGTSSLSISGQQTLPFVGCSASTGPTPNFLPVNITWHPLTN